MKSNIYTSNPVCIAICIVWSVLMMGGMHTPVLAQPDKDAAFLKVSTNWTQTVDDCVTGDNPSGIPGSATGKAPDATGGTGNVVCDDWEVDRYERPLTSTQQDYQAWQDLVEARAYSSNDWWYYWIEVYGINAGNLEGTFLIEADFGDFGGTDCSDYIFWSNDPTSNIVGEVGRDAWSEKGMDSFFDSDNSGTNNVGGQSTCYRADFLDGNNSQGGDGFETQGPKEGSGDIYGMIPDGEGDKVVIIAVRKSALTYPTSTLAPPTEYDWRAWTNQQSNSGSYYQPNDEYDMASGQVGSPYPGDATYPTGGNIKELDNTGIATFIVPGPLPVEMNAFSAAVDGQDVALHWQTASETDNAGFEVEHAAPGLSFTNIGFVEGAGTTQAAQTYRFDVTDLAPGRHAFRLKQVDFDGTFAYTDVVETEVEVAGTFYLSSAYPNPFNPQATLQMAVRETQHVAVGLYNVHGQLVQHLFAGTLEKDQTQTLRLDGASLPSGMYLIQMRGSDFTVSRTAVLSK